MAETWVLDPSIESIRVNVTGQTMTSFSRLYNLIKAVDHLVDNAISGDLVECGVWRGGSLMAMALRLIQRGDSARAILGYDTFEGMTPAGQADRLLASGVHFDEVIRTATPQLRELYQARAGLDVVQHNLATTGFPRERIHLIKGDVLQTLPDKAPDRIALLRLDTDFYDSTWHELVTLYPRLVSGGLLFIDDYGHFKGARDATDKFWATLQKKPMLWAVDYTCRVAVKP